MQINREELASSVVCGLECALVNGCGHVTECACLRGAGDTQECVSVCLSSVMWIQGTTSLNQRLNKDVALCVLATCSCVYKHTSRSLSSLYPLCI